MKDRKRRKNGNRREGRWTGRKRGRRRAGERKTIGLYLQLI